MGEVAVLPIGSVCEALLSGLLHAPPGERVGPWIFAEAPLHRPSLPVPKRFVAPDGSLRVDLMLGDRTWPPERARPASGAFLLIVTSHPLSTRECRTLLGLSSRARRMAAVSTRGLEGAPRRLLNLALHEVGHLKGWRHCRSPGCLMTPVGSAAELDSRRDSPCRKCGAGLPSSSPGSTEAQP